MMIQFIAKDKIFQVLGFLMWSIFSLSIKNLLFNFLDQNKIHFYFLFLDIFKMSIFIFYKQNVFNRSQKIEL